jgi:thymidylate kinase
VKTSATEISTLPAPGSRRVRIVSFSGIDGAGKSTQIAALYSGLRRIGVRVRLLTFWDDVARLAGTREFSSHTLFKGDKGIGSPEKLVRRRDKNVRTWYLTGARFLVYFLDAVSLRRVVAKAQSSDADIVIFDRYLYDELANLSLNNPLARTYARLLLKLAPKPDVAYLLDADPVLARERKPEYPIEFLHTNRAAYLSLGNLVDGMTVIEPMPQHEVTNRVMGTMLTKLALYQ